MRSDPIESLGAVIENLWRTRPLSATPLRQIARRLLLDVWDADPLADPISDGLPQIGQFAFGEPAAILTRNILAARTIALAATSFVAVQIEAEDLVLAALLADAATLRPGLPMAPDDPRHIGIAAALAASLDAVPNSLALRVGRHHERSDGTGIPLGLAEKQLAFGDRLLTAAVRFAEMSTSSQADAASRLHAEARQGLFDPTVTANLVWVLERSLPSDTGFGQSAPEPWFLTDRGRRRLRIDAAHQTKPKPHFGKVAMQKHPRKDDAPAERTPSGREIPTEPPC